MSNLGWTCTGECYEYRENGIIMGLIGFDGNKMIQLGLEQDSPSFRSNVQQLLNYILPNGGNKIFNTVIDPFDNTTYEMDGKTVEIVNGYTGVDIYIYWP